MIVYVLHWEWALCSAILLLPLIEPGRKAGGSLQTETFVGIPTRGFAESLHSEIHVRDMAAGWNTNSVESDSRVQFRGVRWRIWAANCFDDEFGPQVAWKNNLRWLCWHEWWNCVYQLKLFRCWISLLRQLNSRTVSKKLSRAIVDPKFRQPRLFLTDNSHFWSKWRLLTITQEQMQRLKWFDYLYMILNIKFQINLVLIFFNRYTYW